MSAVKKLNLMMQELASMVDNIIIDSKQLNPHGRLLFNPTESQRQQGYRDLNEIGFRVLDYRLFRQFAVRAYRDHLEQASLMRLR